MEHTDNIPTYKITDFNYDYPFSILDQDIHNTEPVPHRHEYLQIIFAKSGVLRHTIGNYTFDMVEGDICVISPYTTHYIVRTPDTVARMIEIEFDLSFINQNFKHNSSDTTVFDFAYIRPFLVSEDLAKPKLELRAGTYAKFNTVLEELLFEFNSKRPDCDLMVKSLLLKLLVMLARENKNAESEVLSWHRKGIENAIKYLEENIADDGLTIEDCARAASLSTSHFRKLFKIVMNKTFLDYKIERRIAKARELMEHAEELNLTEISFACGFSSSTDFSRVFKKQIGLSPSKYRNMFWQV